MKLQSIGIDQGDCSSVESWRSDHHVVLLGMVDFTTRKRQKLILLMPLVWRL